MMDSIKYVIEELNQPPFNQNLNLISYDNLREEQRLDLLIQILNTIDPTLQLPSIHVGNIEDIVATILDTLRIFKYVPPPTHNGNPSEFRKDLLLADKDLLTNIFEWLLQRLPLLKKRAYLARFLVQIELPPDVEGDQDVQVLYKQYLGLIEEFKKIHSSYETQKKSIDSIIELQKDIKSMELEKDQIKKKLDVVKRRVNFEALESDARQRGKFETVRAYVLVKHENEKLQRQLREQLEKIDSNRKQIELQQKELNDLNIQDWNESVQSPEVLLYKLKDEIDIKQKLVKDVLPNELSELRMLVHDMEQVFQQSELQIKEQLTKTVEQIQALTTEINEMIEKKLLDKQSEEDRLSHYRQNAQVVAQKKEETLKQCQDLEKTLAEYEQELEQLRAQFSIDGESTLRADALKLYLEKIGRREQDMNQMKEELNRISSDIDELQSKLRSLKQQEKETMKEIRENEEAVDLEGYFQMKESTLDDDPDQDDQDRMIDFDQMNYQIEKLQNKLEQIKSTLIKVTKEVRILREEIRELESEYEMKKRLYDSAAAGLEAELSRSEAEIDRLTTKHDQLDGECFETKNRLLAIKIEQSQLFGPSTALRLVEQLKTEIENETKLQEQLKQQETEWEEKATYYRQQMEMWRDLRVIMEVKARLLAEKSDNQQRQDSIMMKDHLVLQ